MNKKKQVEILEKILENVKSGKWDINSLEMSQESVSSDNYSTLLVDHHPSGDITIKLNIEDKDIKKAAMKFTALSGLI